MDNRKIVFVSDDEARDSFHVHIDDKKVGYLRKAQHGPGFFLSLENKTWKSSPGARIQQERDFVAKECYAKTKKKAEEIVRENTKND